MWFASIWIFTLKLPWQLGAAFFMEYLFDGDAASNTLSWRWVAGIHTINKAYFASAKNIQKYSSKRVSQNSLNVDCSVSREDKNHEIIPIDFQTINNVNYEILVVDDGASKTYVNSKIKACERVGFKSSLFLLCGIEIIDVN